MPFCSVGNIVHIIKIENTEIYSVFHDSIQEIGAAKFLSKVHETNIPILTNISYQALCRIFYIITKYSVVVSNLVAKAFLRYF